MNDYKGEPVDVIDRLFVGIARIDPPRDFLIRIAAQTYLHEAPLSSFLPKRWFLWMSLDIVAITLFAVLSVSLGIELGSAGTFELLSLVFDSASIAGQFSLLGEAVLQTLPWLQLSLMALNLAAILFLTRRALPVMASETDQVAVAR